MCVLLLRGGVFYKCEVDPVGWWCCYDFHLIVLSVVKRALLESLAVTVVLSTYLFLLPIDDGIELVNSLDGVEAIWYNDEIYYSEGFMQYE